MGLIIYFNYRFIRNIIKKLKVTTYYIWVANGHGKIKTRELICLIVKASAKFAAIFYS